MIRQIKDGDETKKKIIHAAKKEFAHKGFSGARMNSIASIAGVNQALLHYHFENKENLYQQIFHYFIGDSSTKMVEDINSEIDSWQTTVDIKLCAIIYFMVCVHLETRDDELSKIFAREIAEESSTLQNFMKDYMLPRIIIINNIIEDGIKAGIFEISNPKIFTLNLLAFIHDYVHSEELLKGTKWHDELFSNTKEILYNYMIEQSFKVLRPKGKELNAPTLEKDKMNKIDAFIKHINETML